MESELPSRFNEFGEARKNGFLHVKKIKEEGGRVAGIFCTFTPVEILDAADITPVGLCGMSDETIPAAEAHLPKNLCPLIKSSYGFAVSDKCPFTYFSDIIVGETTCDGKKKMYEMLGEIKDTYVLHLPQGLSGEEALQYWIGELRRFIAFLEQKFSITITDEALRQAAKIRNEERSAGSALMGLQKQVPPPAHGYQIYKTMENAGFKFNRREVIDLINDLKDDIQLQYNERRPVPEDAKRILITGCPIGGVLDKTVGAIEKKNGVVVCFENCSGIKAMVQLVDTEAGDIVEAIAERYLKIGCAVMTPNNKRMEHLPELIREFKVDGVVEIDLQACTPYTVEAYSVRKLCEKLEIPYLAIETDYSKTDSGQLSTRLEAFLEMI